MSSSYRLVENPGPVLFSVPHAGTDCPEFLRERLNDDATQLPDTDWFVDRLFSFAPESGQSTLVANNTRYLIDLNRPVSDESLYPGQATTGLCPVVQFDGEPIYRSGQEPDAAEIAERVDRYWQPYHRELAGQLDRIRSLHGYAILFDCHSIASRVPRLFEGTLPVLNLGTNHGATAAPELEQQVTEVLTASGYSTAINGRFVGGTITRSYGSPAELVNALQLEIGWDGYLAPSEARQGTPAWDDAKAGRLIAVLQRIGSVLRSWRP